MWMSHITNVLYSANSPGFSVEDCGINLPFLERFCGIWLRYSQNFTCFLADTLSYIAFFPFHTSYFFLRHLFNTWTKSNSLKLNAFMTSLYLSSAIWKMFLSPTWHVRGFLSFATRFLGAVHSLTSVKFSRSVQTCPLQISCQWPMLHPRTCLRYKCEWVFNVPLGKYLRL